MLAALVAGAMTAAAPSVAWQPNDLKTMRHFASCLVATGGKDIQRYASSVPGSAEESKLANSLAFEHRACMMKSATVGIPNDVLRGFVSQALLERDPTKLEAVAGRIAAAPIRPALGLERQAFLAGYSDCLAKSAPTKSAAVLRTELASPAERVSVVSFGELLKACMPTDAAYHLNATELRINLATAVYRSSDAQRSVS